MARRIFSDFVKWAKDIDKDLFVGVHLAVGFVHAEEPWDLYEPSNVV